MELFQNEGAGAIGLAEIFEAIGQHHQVVIGQVKRQVHIAFAHAYLDLVRGQFFDVLDVGQQGFGRRFGFAAVQIERVNNVIGIQGFARGKGNAFTDVENPFRSARLGFPAFQQFAGGVAVISNFDQAVK